MCECNGFRITIKREGGAKMVLAWVDGDGEVSFSMDGAYPCSVDPEPR